jgi:diaminopimelate decarboxylase
MHYYKYLHDELYCEAISVQKIAKSVETPFYLYSQRTVLENFGRLDAAFQEVDHLICYALKANSNVSLLSLLEQKGAGADVVSGVEIYLALKAGIPPEKIVYAGVGKRDDEIQYALEQGVLAFNVESFEELTVINEIAKTLKRKAPISIRVNPNIDIHGHPYISTGTSVDKFGIEITKSKQIFHDLATFSNVKLVGLHCHLGSQITELKPYVEVTQLLAELVEEIGALGIRLTFVDIGGGLGVRYKNVFQDHAPSQATDSEGLLTPENLVNGILPNLKRMNCKIIFEPGRFLVAEAGILVTRVLYCKEAQGKHFMVVDAGMNDLIRPSLYDAYHEIIPVKKTTRGGLKVDVVGPICESGDFLAKDRWLPSVQRGDLLAIMTAGAYGFSLSSNYNARPRPAEVLVNGEKFKIIRARGTLENLWS